MAFSMKFLMVFLNQGIKHLIHQLLQILFILLSAMEVLFFMIQLKQQLLLLLLMMNLFYQVLYIMEWSPQISVCTIITLIPSI